MTVGKPPLALRYPRGGLRPLRPGELEDGLVFCGRIIEGGSLDAASLRVVSFEGCVFREIDLSGVQRNLIRLADVRLEGCDLSGVRWQEAWLERVQISDCRLMATHPSGAVLRHGCCRPGSADFHGAGLDGADLRSSELAGVTVETLQLLNLAHLLGVRVEELEAV